MQAPTLSCCKKSSKSEVISLEVVRGGSRWWRNLLERAIHGTYTRLNEPPRLVNIGTTGGHSSHSLSSLVVFHSYRWSLAPPGYYQLPSHYSLHWFQTHGPASIWISTGFFKTECSAPYIFSDLIFAAHHLEDRPAVLQVKTFEIISGDRRLVSLYLCFQFVPR